MTTGCHFVVDIHLIQIFHSPTILPAHIVCGIVGVVHCPRPVPEPYLWPVLHEQARGMETDVVSCIPEFVASLSFDWSIYCKNERCYHPELSDCRWHLMFFYLVNITGHLIRLNVQLQGKGNTILSLQQYRQLFAFESKLNVFITDIENGRLTHFKT